MRISKEVAEAIVRHKPVVALESTIIAHGMPYPRNLETAKALESAVREEGAVPATIAVIEGEPVVGLSEEMLLAIATRKDVMKLSRRDLPIALGLGRWGATTVSATIILAAMAGIEVFATGGIGGVHRGAEDTFDISRDLPELGGNDITVVSSGVKAILDLPKTLEVLERHDAPEIESTPVRVGEGMYYLGRAGIYRTALEDGVPSEPELVFNAEGRDRDVWEQQLLAADGMLYFVGGPHGERWLYAIGPADDA